MFRASGTLTVPLHKFHYCLSHSYSIYSLGQIIKSVCVCVSVCVSVCPSASTLTVAFLDRFSPKLAQT